MEEDDDDLYEPTASSYANGTSTAAAPPPQQIKAEDQEDGEEEGEEIEEDDSDSDIDIITERKPGTKQSHSPQASRLDVPKTTTTTERPGTSDRTTSHSRAITIKPSPSHPPTTSTSTTSSTDRRPGNSYPAISISSLDINGPIPLFDALNKPLTDLDFDVDLAEVDKPWRRPGADQSEWFNYGFDEFTWATYCLRQKEMRAGIEGQKAEAAKFEMMFGGGMPGMPSAAQGPGQGQGQRDGSQAPQQGGQQAGQMGGMNGMGGMPGMPDMNPEMMNAMMQQMMASGMDPSQMDFGTFMQQMQGGGQGMPGMGMGGQGGQGGYGGEQQFYGGGGGYGRGGGGRRGRR